MQNSRDPAGLLLPGLPGGQSYPPTREAKPSRQDVNAGGRPADRYRCSPTCYPPVLR
jgi:hypothetical protein